MSRVLIVYITTGLSTGGAEIILYRILSKINREYFSPVVISLMDYGRLGDKIEALDIPIYTIGIKKGMPPTPASIWRIIHIVRKLKPNLIQGWMYHGNLAAQLVSYLSFTKIPVLWSIHSSIYSLGLTKKMTATVIKLCAGISKAPSKIMYVSQIGKLQHENLGYSNQNSCVIPNGTDTSVFKPSVEARLTVRKELGLSENTFLIGLICRYHPMKDHANFLQAAAILLKNYPDTNFLLIGTEVTLENQILYQLIQELGIIDRVHLLGERTDIPRLTAALDIASSSSAYGEGWPLIIGEAMSCGVPCVVTDVGDSGWIVADTGRIVPPKNSEALANAWQELLMMDSEQRQKLGMSARQRVVENFSLEAVVNRYEAIYSEILK
ncbi:glycosyltransferase family 4 protein [Dendronalium sp. ChiSLP03b]|uniref:glycosyltransferase family 4 protein n=1 Tax=Dendronalium sp. ChiSLP03b TaxID=3075381 RepID=UPI002AD416F5|nr:glycosyltransferase [Dendronalium sp. ChiSLP03b]MDZ8204097.1 glycosyltransferase [Dendronalium sp. ChiSLP03b]